MLIDKVMYADGNILFMETILDDIPDHIDMARPGRWVNREHRYSLSEVRKDLLASMDSLFCMDIACRKFLWNILSEYPFLLDSKEKMRF